ncbi:homeobox 12 [Tasmannia lanceolata]|uniref:homeobox 12 n=1 Tax=Tasmannia lanceolata TaxID=3420 RepID=UPI004063E212
MESGGECPTVRTEDCSHRKKKEKMKNKRFSDEQIRSLECMFEEETKLEPGRKLQLARELGLQPRQIAIWFQNRRARCKSKQLEREYNMLRESFDSLASSFDCLKKEKQCLLIQMQKLRERLEKTHNDGETKSGECEEKPKLIVEERPDVGGFLCENGKKMEGELDLLNIAQPSDSSLTLTDKWCGFDSGYFSDQSCSDFQWWEIWP